MTEIHPIRFAIYNTDTEELLGYKVGSVFEISPNLFRVYSSTEAVADSPMFKYMMFTMNKQSAGENKNLRIEAERLEDSLGLSGEHPVTASTPLEVIATFTVERVEDKYQVKRLN